MSTGAAKDAVREYPGEFVDALTKAGFLAALIPVEHGGSGLSLEAACVIMEEIQAAGCNGSSAHAQMYIMNTLLRYGSEEQKAHYLPRIASGKLRFAGFWRVRTDQRHRYIEPQDPRGLGWQMNISSPARRSGPARAEHSDLMMLLARTTPARASGEQDRGVVDLPRRHAGGAAKRHEHQADPHDDEPFVLRSVLR